MKIQQPTLKEYTDIINALSNIGFNKMQIAMILQEYESGSSLSLAMIHENPWGNDRNLNELPRSHEGKNDKPSL